MFGLFQADLPIGHRMWLLLLAIVVGGSIAATPLAEVAIDPVSFGGNLLLLFGQSILLATIYLAPLYLVLAIIEHKIKSRADKDRHEFYLCTEDYNLLSERALNSFAPAGYVIAVIWVVDGNFSTSLGSLGLALFLFAEVVGMVGPNVKTKK